MVRAKQTIKENFIYLIEFLFFAYVIFKAPPVADRWMEGVSLYDLESPWRYIFGQWRWIETANSRVFSNIFSMIVDRDPGIRALINAFMLTAITCIIVRICTKEEKHFSVKYLTAFCMVLVSWGIWSEVYFYAATLYISGILILTAVIRLMQKIRLKSICRREKILLYILLLLGSTWIENVSLALLGCVLACFIVNWLSTGRINKTQAAALAVCAAGLALMYLNSILASAGRLRKTRSLNLPFDNISRFAYDNILLVGILAAVAVMLCFKMKKQLSKGNQIFIFVQSLNWLILLGISLLMGMKHIYDIVRVDPEQADYVNLIFGWVNFDNELINSFLDGPVYRFLWLSLPFLLLLGMISLVCLLYRNDSLMEGCALLGMGTLGIAIDVLGLQEGARISSPAVYALIGLTALIFSKISADSYKKGHWFGKFFLFLIGAAAVINMDSMLIFLHIQDKVADKRWEIADAVREKQILGDWDYDDWVVMPKYATDKQKPTLVGEERKNPHNKDDYYDILLRYYDLDPDTKLIFSDDDVQLIKLVNEQDNSVTLYLNKENKWDGAKYKFILYKNTPENILEESEWSSDRRYKVLTLENARLRAKCYLSIDENIVKETVDTIIWTQ